MESKYFITVQRCGQGPRGIFCSELGTPFSKDEEPHTEEEMREVLGSFDMILGPKSELLNEEHVKEMNQFRPLKEYSMRYGIAYKKE